jgi:hypothetical protein
MDHPRNIIVISDTHCGCRLGLCTKTVKLDGGGTYTPSTLQKKVASFWKEFWGDWVPKVTRGEPYIVVHNGDAIDGVHHRSTTQISHNLYDQTNIAYDALMPVVEGAAAYYHVRGTEAHVGQSGEDEEKLAKLLGAIPNKEGDHARWELWINLHGHLIHFTHHIGVTGSSAYEATAVGKEMVENYVESGRWGRGAAQVVVRSHRHRFGHWKQYGEKGMHISTTTPGWQLKTPHVFKGGGRLSQPQFGGVMIRVGDEELYTRERVWTVERPQVENYA